MHKRRKHIIRPAFQWKYTALMVVGVFAVSTFITLTVFGLLYQEARAAALTVPTTSYKQLVGVLVLCSLAFAIAPAIAFGLWSIFFTHRVCGPLYVMEKCFKEMIAGEFPKRRELRKHDEFKDFYETFWQAINTSKARRESELAALQEILKVAQSGGADGQSVEVLGDVAERVKALCVETRCALNVSEKPIAVSR